MARLSEEAIENQAKRVRKKLNLSHVLAPNMHCVLEDLQSMISKFKFKPALASDMAGNEAIMNDDTHTLTVQERVLEDTKAGKCRARFTIAHELGHYFLGHTGVRRRNTDKTVYAGARERIEEREADIFASYLLVPTELALDAANSEEISQRFQVSAAVAEIAFERIEKAKRRASGLPRRSPPSVVDFLREARKRGHPVRSDIYDADE